VTEAGTTGTDTGRDTTGRDTTGPGTRGRAARLRRVLARLDHAERRGRYLLPAEEELWRTRRHWVVLVKPGLWVLGVLVVAGVLAGADPALDRLVSLGLLAAVVHVLLRVLAWWDLEYVLTDRRVLLQKGFPRRRVASMGLRKITDMSFEQSIPGRVAGYGDLVVESAGQDQALSRLDHVPRAGEFYAAFSAQLFPASPTREPGRREY
jgi:hypothetical protein